jgi:hypothetical protein
MTKVREVQTVTMKMMTITRTIAHQAMERRMIAVQVAATMGISQLKKIVEVMMKMAVESLYSDEFT